MLTIIYTFIAFLAMAIAIIIFVYYSRKKILKAELQKKNLEIAYQKDLLQSTILSQEQERKRIARDLHDAISSKLNVVSLNAQMIRGANVTETEKEHMLDSIISQSKDLTENARRIAHNLLPAVLEKFGLQAALEELRYEYNTTKKMRIHIKNELHFETLQPDVQLHLFRIIQELVSNSLKHGNASDVEIHFTKNKDRNTCIYCDNGIGFDLSGGLNKSGLGLKNIESRLKLLQSELLTAKADKGVKILFDF